ncbi:MAG: cytochrome P450 [Ruegeria sp.]|uniref:cytochrome P450 n=1 Tax=Ruegeria sp. TaxID=1879320 RepID=UPI00349ED5B4
MLRIDYENWPNNWANLAGHEGSATETPALPGTRSSTQPEDPTAPDLSYLKQNFAEALASFYATIARILEDNPVDLARLSELAAKAAAGDVTPDEITELQTLKVAATRQGRAVGGVYGFFLKYKPYPMLSEIRAREKLFQPPLGPVLVVDGGSVRDVLTRHDAFTVDPYGREMIKSMTPAENGGFDAFILGTDDAEKFIEDKTLLTTVVNKDDPAKITELVHQDCIRRVEQVVDASRADDQAQIDVVTALARFVPVTVSHHYFGIPTVEEKGAFELTLDMLRYYGTKVAGPDGVTPLPTSHTRPDGSTVDLPDSALGQSDGVTPDEAQVYEWIKAAFQNFFNNVQKDVEVQAQGVRAYRELLVYLLRELDIQRAALTAGDAVPDTMVSRLLKLQMGLADPELTPDPEVDPARVGDLRIVENVMGTVVGAVAGQEEATCRMIDSILRLKEGEFEQDDTAPLCDGQRYGSFEEARQLALNVLENRDVAESRWQLRQYALEALRLQPQAEILLRECREEGATISGSRPIRAGTLIFVAHGSAMKDVEQPDAFIVGRDAENYLQFGHGRHKCLGQYISPVILVETLIAVLALDNLRRPDPRPGESAFPLERRFGRLQLDDNNLYAKTFTLEFDLGGTTDRYFS